MLSLTLEEMTGVTRIAEKAVTTLVGPVGAALVAGSVVVSTFGCNVAGRHRRVAHLLRDGRRRPFLSAGGARVHRCYRTPHVALLVTGVWSAFLTLTGGYETLFTYVTFASVLFGTLGGIAIFVLRVRRSPTCRARIARWAIPVIPASVRAGLVRAGVEHADGAAGRSRSGGPRPGGAGPAVLLALVAIE